MQNYFFFPALPTFFQSVYSFIKRSELRDYFNIIDQSFCLTVKIAVKRQMVNFQIDIFWLHRKWRRESIFGEKNNISVAIYNTRRDERVKVRALGRKTILRLNISLSFSFSLPIAVIVAAPLRGIGVLSRIYREKRICARVHSGTSPSLLGESYNWNTRGSRFDEFLSMR